MSASQAAILDSLNLRLGDVRNIGVGVDARAHVGRLFGMTQSNRVANTSDAAATVQAVAITTHKWATKVGKYNNDPIWGAIFQNIQENRRRLKEGLNELE